MMAEETECENPKLLNVGIIGLGTISNNHAHGFLKDGRSKVAAVCDLYEDLAKARAEKWGATKTFTDYKALLRDKEIDAVDICLPPKLHAKVAVEAAEAGKHILTEKPMALTLKDCDAMISAARKNDVKLMVTHNQLFYPPHQEARRLVAEEIGKPITSTSILYGGMPASDWRCDPKISGGFMLEAVIHRFYVSRFLMGEVKRVSCMTAKSDPDLLCEDKVMVNLEFEGGRHGVINANRCGPFGLWDDRTEVVGEDGMVIINGVEDQIIGGPPLLHYRNGMWRSWCNTRMPEEAKDQFESKPPEELKLTTYELDDDFNNTFYYVTRHFVDSIINNKTPFVSGEEGKRLVQIIQACYESAEKGKVIDV
jgi:UDP-N-acetylglucosamine 3-dehydrogenase